MINSIGRNTFIFESLGGGVPHIPCQTQKAIESIDQIDININEYISRHTTT